LFLHYWGWSAGTWDKVIEHLAGQDAVVYDQRGWGTAASVSGPYSLDQMAADVDAVAAHEGLEHVVLVGHSMCGKVAQIVAGRQPAYLSAESVRFSVDHVLTHKPLAEDLREQVVHDSLG
jgi:pimeloyl-ACP methyl ester carboxylesterase